MTGLNMAAAVCVVVMAAHLTAGFQLHGLNGGHSSVRHLLGAHKKGSLQNDPTNVTRYYTQQTLDHFDDTSNAVWTQRYFVNDTFYKERAGAPVFMCCGGEGPALSPQVVVTGTVHCGLLVELAQTHNALIVALEHRYYGLSHPTEDFSTPNLQYLSSRQALADIAQFHEYIQTTMQLPSDSRWITFGGSYPGMVAGWARLIHPDKIYASVSSSSPVEAQLNFKGYNDVVAASMALSPVVKGSTECADILKKGYATVGLKLLAASTRRELESQFNVCENEGLEVPENRGEFVQALQEILPVQTNDPCCTTPLCNIEKVCAQLQDGDDSPINKLAALTKSVFGGCISVNHENTIKSLTNTTIEGGQGRIWFYQTCTEFAFYQTCDPGTNCLFTQHPHLITVQASLDLCKAAYGITADEVTAAVARSNSFYGGNQPNGTRILFVNGGVDPWHVLSVLKPIGTSEPALFLETASHHAWTHADFCPTDGIKKIRDDIADQIATWVQQD